MFHTPVTMRRHRRAPRPCFQPKLETLEERLTPTYSLTDLGTAGGVTFAPDAINDSGQVLATAGVFTPSGVGHQAFLFSNNQWNNLGAPNGFSTTTPAGINDTGQILTQASTSTGVTLLFLYNSNTGQWADITPSLYYTFSPIAINNSTQVLGNKHTGTGTDAYSGPMLFTPGTGQWIDLGTPPGYSYPFGVALNNSGQVLVVASAGSGASAVSEDFLYDSSSNQWEDLGRNSQGATVVAGKVNDSGQVVIETDTGALLPVTHLDLFSAGRWSDLGAPDEYSNPQLFGFNNSGQVLAAASTGNGLSPITHPFLYANGQWTDLNSVLPPGSTVTLTAPENGFAGINNNGQIETVGSDGHVYLLTPQQAPPGSGSAGTGAGSGSGSGPGPGGVVAGHPTPSGGLSLFGFGFGPEEQLDLFEVDQSGQVFTLPLFNFFGGAANPTPFNGNVSMRKVQLFGDDLVGFFPSTDGLSYMVVFLDISNPYVFHAIEAAVF